MSSTESGKICLNTLLASIICTIAACGLPQSQDIPNHPDKLNFHELKFQIPDPATMHTQLSNGMVTYLLEDESLPLVHLQILLRGGSFWDPKGKQGVSAMTASLMRTAGTKRRSPKEIDEELEFLAASITISLGTTSGSASLSVLKKDLNKGLELLVDMLRNPAFQQEKLDLLKAQMAEQLKARNDHTSSIEAREAALLLYGDYPINHLTTKASIESITRQDLQTCHEKNFYPANMIIAAAGAFKRSELIKRLEEAFKEMPNKDTKFEIPKVTHNPQPGIYCFHKEGKNVTQGRVTIAHLGIDIHHPDVQAIRVMSYIFGAGGFSSRLVQRVRSDEGLVYDVRSDFLPGTEYTGAFQIRFQSKSESCAYAAKLCLEELAKIQQNQVTEQELKDAQKFYLDAFPGLFFKTKFQTVNTFATAELNRIPKDYYQTYREKIAKLTVQDIQRVAKQHLHTDRFVFILVGDIPAIKKGDKHAKLSDLGRPIDIPLSDPLTLERPKSGS